MEADRIKRRRMNRVKRIKSKVLAQEGRPKVVVDRTMKHIYAQLVDHDGRTLTTVGTNNKIVSQNLNGKTSTIDAAKAVGVEIAKRAKKLGILQISFDRNGFIYHGRVKALAEAARENGLKF